MRTVRCVLALALVSAAAAGATAQVRLAELSGIVTDDSGGVLPGVTVTVTQVGTKNQRSDVTQASGTYFLAGLEPGVYEIRFELVGFTPVVFESTRLAIGQSQRVDTKLTVATIEETVRVVGEAPIVDTTKSTLSGRISQTQVEELPVNGRNWLNFAALAPGVKGDVGQNPQAGVGRGQIGSKVFVDGASTQTASTVGVQTEVSKDVIGEFEVLTNRFDAQLGHAGSVIINAVTKSGTDAFSGSAFYYFRDRELNARDFFTGIKEPYRNQQFGGTTGGPIKRGMTRFFTSYERQAEPTTKSANTGFPSLDRPVDADDTKNLGFWRVDHNFTTNHRVTIRQNYYDRNQPYTNTGGAIVPSASTNFNIKTWRTNGGVNSVFGSRLVNQLQFNYTDSEQFFSRSECGYAPATGDCPTHTFPSVRIGPQPNVGFELHNWLTIRSDATYFFEKKGSHNVKFGGEITTGHVIIFFPNATNGVFFYNSNPPNLATCCEGSNQRTWDVSQFPIPARYNVGLGDFQTKAPNDIYGLYLQDDWTVGRVTLNLGVRYDLEVGSLANDQSGLTVAPAENDTDNVQPRLGFAWDVTGTGRTVVRGGGGKYYDQVYLNLTYNQLLQNSGKNVNVTLFNTNNDPTFADDPLRGQGFDELQSLGGLRNVSRIQRGAEQPHTWSGSIGVAQQVASTLAISADYVYQKSDALLVNIDSNLACCLANGFPVPVNSGTYPELGGFVQGVGRPNPNFGTITDYTFQGRAVYHGLQVGVTKRMAQNYQLGLTYLLSKNDDTATTLNNPFDLEADYGRSSQDQRHRLTANWVVRLPYAFNFNGIFYAASGQAIGATTGGIDINGDVATAGDRPTCGLDARFAPGCAALGIPNGQVIPRNPLRSEAVARFDVRLSRTFAFGTVRVEPLFEVFNLFNRRNYDPGAYQTSLANVRFGQEGRSSSLPYQPRQIQVGGRLTF
jgi:hypothetical protein